MCTNWRIYNDSVTLSTPLTITQPELHAINLNLFNNKYEGFLEYLKPSSKRPPRTIPTNCSYTLSCEIKLLFTSRIAILFISFCEHKGYVISSSKYNICGNMK